MHIERFFIDDEFLIQLRDTPGNDPGAIADRANELMGQIDKLIRNDLGLPPADEDSPYRLPKITGENVIRFGEPLHAHGGDDVSKRANFSSLGSADTPAPTLPMTLAHGKITKPYLATETLKDSVARLVTTAKAHQAELSRDFEFQYIAPNWLFAGSQGTMPTGGPGGRPISVLRSQVSIEAQGFKKQSWGWLLDLYARISSALNVTAQTASAVNVVILDTAPDKAVLDAAYRKFDQNQLLQTLQSNLHITYARDIGIDFTILDQNPPPDPGIARQPTHPEREAVVQYYKRNGGYPMPDHGLFIAGIVHKLAPKANIYLVQVLNEYGCGTLESITRGLAAVKQDALIDADGNSLVLGGGPLVINMSICIDFDSVEEVARHFTAFGIDTIKWALSPFLSQLNFLQGLPHDKEDLFEAVKGAKRNQNVVVVAAAGNQADPNLNTPPGARYPAAYDGVIGISALDKNDQRAWYSNLADAPPPVGVAVLGGKTTMPGPGQVCLRLDSTSMPGESLLSLYISEFFPNENGKPDQQLVNDNGWAWWSGTSFSTAVMSGIMAEIAERGIPFRQQFLNAELFIRIVTLLRGWTRLWEPILEVSQG